MPPALTTTSIGLNTNLSRFTQAYVVPVSTYLAVAIAGGYGTGREVVQFFSGHGAMGGLFGIGLSALLLALTTALSFEFARLHRVYDYRSFLQELIGPYWILFEVLYLLLLFIVLAVVTSAAGAMLSNRIGVSENYGLFAMVAIIGCLLFFGRSVVERSMVIVTALLAVAFSYYFVAVISADGSRILEQLNQSGPVGRSWIRSAAQFALYSGVAAVIALFSTTGIDRRIDAFRSGALCGVLIMVPGLLFHLSFLGRLVEVNAATVPIYWMIDRIDAPALMTIYLVAMFATFLGTGLGFLQALNERLDAWSMGRHGRRMGGIAHVGVGVVGLLISAGLAQFGIIALIARGYGTMAWGFLVVFFVPLLTVGASKIWNGAFSTRAKLSV